MVILAAFYILLTHICSHHYLLPSGQTRRSNAFSPCQEPPFAGRQKSGFQNAGCWHTTLIISTTFSSNHRRNHPRKHIRFKSMMPTSCNLLVPSILTTSGNVLPTSIAGSGATASGGSNKDNFIGFINSQSFGPPGLRPTRTGTNKNPTKTQATTECKAEKKTSKAKGIVEKKSAAASRRADAKTKKQEKLISAAETKAQKAVTMADKLRKKLEETTKGASAKTPVLSSGGMPHSNEKSKGAAGRSTPTSSITAASSHTEAPQHKPFSAKKWMNNSSPF
jgi:hypothetical protein